MKIEITEQYTKTINLADAMDTNGSHLYDAAINLSKFGDYSDMDGSFIFNLTAKSMEDAEEKMHDLLSMFDLLCNIKVFKPDFRTVDPSELPTGIDFVDIDFSQHCNYMNAWSDKGRRDAIHDTAYNELRGVVGGNMYPYTNVDDFELVLFFIDDSIVEELGYDSLDEAIDEYPALSSVSLPDEIQAIIDELDKPIYGNIATIPKTIAEKYFDLDGLDFS